MSRAHDEDFRSCLFNACAVFIVYLIPKTFFHCIPDTNCVVLMCCRQAQNASVCSGPERRPHVALAEGAAAAGAGNLHHCTYMKRAPPHTQPTGAQHEQQQQQRLWLLPAAAQHQQQLMGQQLLQAIGPTLHQRPKHTFRPPFQQHERLVSTTFLFCRHF